MNQSDYIIAVLLSGIFVMSGCTLYLVVSIAHYIRRIHNNTSITYTYLRDLKEEAERRYNRG